MRGLLVAGYVFLGLVSLYAGLKVLYACEDAADAAKVGHWPKRRWTPQRVLQLLVCTVFWFPIALIAVGCLIFVGIAGLFEGVPAETHGG